MYNSMQRTFDFHGRKDIAMSGGLVSGVRAAIGIPRDEAGQLDEPSLRSSIEFLMGRGIRGFAINGATGEYCLTTPAELMRVVAATAEVTQGHADFICGIGSAGISGCLENARIAARGGARALLLPMPHFFSYEQTDLDAFCRAVAQRAEAPILLYNLPFNSPLMPETVRALIEDCPNIIGIKDSIGNVEILRALTLARVDACRIVGSDGILEQALRERICDGVISGVASVLPQLILSIYRHAAEPNSEEFQDVAVLLKEFIDALEPYPVPWGLKLIGEFAGIVPAGFSQPLSPQRRVQAEELKQWFSAWQASPKQQAACSNQ
jgi:4-hydroxy-tetrahydrodipicolinate synthase